MDILKNKNWQIGSIAMYAIGKKNQSMKCYLHRKIKERNRHTIQKEGIHMVNRHIK